MISIGICDNESAMRKKLHTVVEQKLQLLGQEFKIFEFKSGEDLLENSSPDSLTILFLDIEMDVLNGVETAKILRKRNYNTIIIFVTAYDDFVFQGYEVHAFHYILKPYKEKKICEVLEQALNEIHIYEDQFFTIEQKSGIKRISLKKIKAFSSDRRKVYVITDDGEEEFYGKLTDIEETLPVYFVRIHNRHLVNLNYITSIEKNECICDTLIFPISRTYKHDVEIAFARSLLH